MLAIQKEPLCCLHVSPSLLQNDHRLAYSGFHQLLLSGDATTVEMILDESYPLMDKVDWDRNLAIQAVRKTPKLYLYLPQHLTQIDDKELAAPFHKLLRDGDRDIIRLLLKEPKPLIDRVVWDRELALQAVQKTPKLYLYLPPSLTTTNDRELASSFHKLVASGDQEIINLLLKGPSPLMVERVSWDRELALQAVRTTPKLYLYLPSSLTNNNDKELATPFHNRLVAGDQTIIGLLLDEPLPLISRVIWDKDLALRAVRKTPRLYPHLPASVKDDDVELAMAAIMAPNAKVDTILKQVAACCGGLFSDSAALQEIFGKEGNRNLVTLLLTHYSDKIIWNKPLADLFCKYYPVIYHYLPASCRDDGVDAQRVMAELLQPRNRAGVAQSLDFVLAAVPGFFANRDDVHELFRLAQSDVAREIVKGSSSTIPWDKELTRFVAKLCHDRECWYDRRNVADVEIKRIFKGRDSCKHHIPVGMLLSYVVAEAAEVWPDFLFKCRCSLARNDADLKKALEFVVPMLWNMKYLSSKTTSWLERLVRRIKNNYFQNMEIMQTFLLCISVADGGAPLECLKGNDETSVALKRNIAEYLGAMLSRTQKEKLKKDALMIVYCLLTLPPEFPNEGLNRAAARSYKAPYRPGEDTFYCETCCKTLTRLDKKYKNNNNDDDEEEDDSDDEVDDSDEVDDDEGSMEEQDSSEESEDDDDEDEL